ncbi:MAG: HD domain-containing protein [Gammaproteobacteria bacterium]|nr:HD domain-containing protein [Gammaproteobacteria bacterium]
MNHKYQNILEIVKKELSCSAHDLGHVMRVVNLSEYLAQFETDVNLDVLTKAALLHDIARVQEDTDPTGAIDHAILGAQMAENILKKLNDLEHIEAIKHCIRSHRFKKGAQSETPKTIEAKLLYDADKIDVLGAIGIARCFIIAGEYREQMFSDVALASYLTDNIEGNKPGGRIKDLSKHSPNLEYELKLKYIPEKLYTQKAKEIAQERAAYMDEFFKKLAEEFDVTFGV